MPDFPLKRYGWRWSARAALALAALALITGCGRSATAAPGLATEPPLTQAPASAAQTEATHAPTNTPRPTVTDLPTVTATRPPTSATPRPSPTRRPPTATRPAATAMEPTATVTAESTLTVTVTITPATPEATAGTPATPQPTQGSGDFAPTEPGRWNTSTPTDQMAGDCSASVLAPYGPAIIRPTEGGLGWYNTAQEEYTLARQALNVYSYSGPTTRGEGTVTLHVTFNSLTTLSMTRVFVPNAEPGCTHNYAQTGTFEFAVP